MEYAQVIIDEVSDTVTYIGYCFENFIPTSAPRWTIVRVESSSGGSPSGVVTIKSAGFPGAANQVWDDRLSLNYVS